MLKIKSKRKKKINFFFFFNLIDGRGTPRSSHDGRTAFGCQSGPECDPQLSITNGDDEDFLFFNIDGPFANFSLALTPGGQRSLTRCPAKLYGRIAFQRHHLRLIKSGAFQNGSPMRRGPFAELRRRRKNSADENQTDEIVNDREAH